MTLTPRKAPMNVPMIIPSSIFYLLNKIRQCLLPLYAIMKAVVIT